MDQHNEQSQVNCKCCNKSLKVTSILKHLGQKSKWDCKGSYTEAELASLKEEAETRRRSKTAKWKSKNQQYYSTQRRDYYEKNKEVIAKKDSEKYQKNKKKINKKHAEYYKKNKYKLKYISKFYYEMNSISLHSTKTPDLYRTVVSGFIIRCLETEEQYKNMLEDVPLKWKSKSLKFLGSEIEHTTTWLRELITNTFKKFEAFWSRYDEQYKQEIFYALHTLIGIRLEQVKSLLSEFLEGDENETSIIKQYLSEEDLAIDEYNNELLRMKEAMVQRAQGTLQEKLDTLKVLTERYDLPSFIQNKGTKIIAFFKTQEKNAKISARLQMLEELIKKTITALQSQIKETADEIEQIICQWSTGCKKWREKEASDLSFMNDMFEMLKYDLHDEKNTLWHKLQANFEYMCKHFDVKPPEELHLEDFCTTIKKTYKCDDPNCICLEIDITE